MSALLNQILQAGGGSAVDMIAGRFGISPTQSRMAIEALAPMITGGLKNQANAQGGIEGLLGSVLSGNHVAIGENPEELARPGTTALGNEVLGAIFGSKDVSRQVATQAAGQTGLSSDLLKQILPIVAAMAAGSVANNANQGGLGGLLGNVLGAANAPQNGNANAGALGGIANMLDLDGDGNPLDDIMGMLTRR
jgi:hypothetical protein